MHRLVILVLGFAACGDNLNGNTPPTIVELNLTTDEDTPLTRIIDAEDRETETLTITLGQPLHGTVAMSAGSFTYTPAANYNGTDAFSVTVSDGDLETMGTMSVTITAVNDAPTGVADSFATNEDSPHEAEITALLANDTDVDGDPLSITSVGNPQNGSVAIVGTDVVFTPTLNFTGAGTYRYTVSDGTLTSDVTVTVTVGGVNDPPVAVNDTRTTAEDTALVVAGSTLVANDTDPENQTLTVMSVTNGTNGTVALSGGNVTFTPTANFNGSGSFDYVVTDGALTDTGTVTVTISAVNDVPVAVTDNVATDEDTPITVTQAQMIANDTDVENDALTVTAVSNPIGGTVTFSNGSATFTPTANFNGTGRYNYTITDGTDTDEGVVFVTINPINDPPVAVDDMNMAAEDTPVTFPASQLTANDIDVDGDALTVTSVTAVSGGTVVLANGMVTFTPAANFNGNAFFDYVVQDPSLLQDTGRVTIFVGAANDPPVAVDDSATTQPNTPVVIPAASVLANDTDPDAGDTLTVISVMNATDGSVAFDSVNNTITFTPANGFTGNATFEYTVSDSGNLTDVARVIVSVTACVPVDDMIACTMDVCQNGMPVNLPNHLACEVDGAACTVPTCSTTTGCSETPNNAICDDAATCTSEVCSPTAPGANGAGCVVTPDNTVCSDTLTCTTDTCSPGAPGANGTTGCVNTSTCNDNIACTVDACGAGGCTSTPDNSLCSSGDVCVAGSGCRTPPSALVITELGILGSGTAEMIELHNPSNATVAIDGVSLQNMAGQIAVIRSSSDPTGTSGTLLTLAPGAYAWGVPNPANAANIPAGANFVYGAQGTTFAFADTGDLVTVTGQDTTLLDMVDFTALITDPTVALSAAAFPAFAGHTTQLHATILAANANDSGGDWCTTFRTSNTAGAANQSCTVAVINEVLIDSAGGDDGNTFLEIAGPGGGQIGGATIEDIEGKGASVGTRNATTQTIPVGRRIPTDGLLVVADELGTGGTTTVANFDLILNDVDFENSGGDSIQLIASNGTLLDVVGHDVTGANLDATTATVNGLAMFEAATAITPASVASLGRDVNSTDTGNNRNDFHNDPSPTPGTINTPVVPTITSISPNDGLATTTTPLVRVTGTDLGAGVVTVNGVAATSCSFTSPTGATCTFPASAGNAVGRVDVVYTNNAANGGTTATAVNGWTYTGVLNETNVAGEADFCNLQFPTTLAVMPGQQTPPIFGQIFEAGLTDATVGGAAPGILAEVGHGPGASNPTSVSTWSWFATTFNVEAGVNNNNDEYQGTFTAPAAGTYAYTYRFSLDNGINWTYCDTDGAGSNAGSDFSSASLGVMTVSP